MSTKRRIPAGLGAGRRSRSRRTVTMPVTVEYALRAGEPFLRADVTVDNHADDHRVRVHVPLPFRASASHADAAFWVQERGLEAEGAAHEHPTPTFPARRFVDASEASAGAAVLLAGTPEYELVEGREIAVTLLRCVGWLSRQDLRLRSGPAGPAFEAPGAQLHGTHRFALALYPHGGDWEAAGVAAQAERFSLPLRTLGVRASAGSLALQGAAVGVEPETVRLSTLERRDGATEVRLYNPTGRRIEATLRLGPPLSASRLEVVDLLGRPRSEVAVREGVASVEVAAGQIVTLELS